jgi:hypothetical protein
MAETVERRRGIQPLLRVAVTSGRHLFIAERGSCAAPSGLREVGKSTLED